MSAERKVFGKLQGMASPMPDLIDIQTKAYQDFLQSDIAPQKREEKGLQAIFKEIFPVASYDGRYKLDFVGYNLEPEKKSYLQALMDGESYVRPLLGRDIALEKVLIGLRLDVNQVGHGRSHPLELAKHFAFCTHELTFFC